MSPNAFVVAPNLHIESSVDVIAIFVTLLKSLVCIWLTGSMLTRASHRHQVSENPLKVKFKDPKTGDLIGIGTAFLRRIDESERWQAELIRGIKRMQNQNPDFVSEEPSRWHQQDTLLFTEHVLSRLFFRNMEDRQHRIPEAYQQTYEWIFTDNNMISGKGSSYTDWLEKQSGLYWITGKPGAGKSTMLKFLASHPSTSNHLQVWSAGSRLYTSKFFFWNSGQKIQMSKEGLLRSLLYEILASMNADDAGYFVPALFPAKWEAFNLFGQTVEAAWTWLELELAFVRLLKMSGPANIKLCFFIDGLDEFDGSPFELIKFFKELLGDSKHLKACISSRPWTMFEDVFKSYPHFSLEDFTRNDILRFITNKLETNEGFREIQAERPQFALPLIEDIAKKSSGVFLWVDLVMKSLLEGLTQGDYIVELRRRVDDLPDDLENLFRSILDGVLLEKPAYFVSACKFFKLVRAALEPLTLYSLYLADEDSEDPTFFDSIKVSPSTASERWSQAATMKRRLNARTKGLLEVDRFSNVS